MSVTWLKLLPFRLIKQALKSFLPLGLSFLMLVAGCQGKKEPLQSHALIKKEYPGCYQIQGTTVVSVSGFDALKNTDFRPWLLQKRVTGFLEVSGKLYCAINGIGLEALSLASRQLEAVEPLLSRELFEGRTLGNQFLYKGEIILHVYRNSFHSAPVAYKKPLTVIGYDPRQGTADMEALSFQQQEPDWEAVELFPVSDAAWYIAWKRLHKGAVSYIYQRYYPAAQDGEIIDWSTFINGYAFSPLGKAPKPLQNIMLKIRSGLKKETVVHITVNASGTELPRRFRYGSLRQLAKGEAPFLAVEAFTRGGTVWVLDAGKEVMYMAEEGMVKRVALPQLPAGFKYTHFWINESSLLLSWEEQHSIEVGKSGLLVLDSLQ